MALIAAAVSACAPTAVLMTPPPTVKAPAGHADDVTGGVAFSSGGMGASVSYGPWRVTGAGLDLSYAGDGAWTGTWNGAPARFVASQGRVQGPGTELLVEQHGDTLSIRGTFTGRGVEVTVGRKGLRARLDPGGCTLELTPAPDGILSGPVGCPGSAEKAAASTSGAVRLLGEAVLVPGVLLPQFVLAVLATLP
jgi:hypothetical protein